MMNGTTTEYWLIQINPRFIQASGLLMGTEVNAKQDILPEIFV